ncbi:MAG: MarR family transcriptional regulator [Proteobacteria bacterium]|nr:MarR family transcriptional regulator [Pseudomonadota bacterium]
MSKKPALAPQAASLGAGSERVGAGKLDADFELIELLFFAYRDFVGEPDRLLAVHGFGRAHHRVLHFVNRHQGLTVAELLEILEITKQSLARVLKDLINAGFIEQRAGDEDRRQRRLYLTAQGEVLAYALAGMQGQRMARALAEAGAADRPVIKRFLEALIDPERRATALAKA